MNGLLILNKPSGVTSRHVVDVAERWFPGVKIGHAGTLDPLATGVLVLCLGSATRLIEYVQDLDKTYTAKLRLGAWSDTDDSDGKVDEVVTRSVPEVARVEEALSLFVGEITQTPPAYSAARLQGRRAHHLARRGHDVELRSRSVRIYSIKLIRFGYPNLVLTIDCGKGTYIRSLARDLGERLGCGALVAALERTRIGPFHIGDALDLSTDPAIARERVLLAKAAVAHLPAITLPASQLRRLCHGQVLTDVAGAPVGEVAVFNTRAELAAIAVVKADGSVKARKTLG
jgi:tRNA pseudouridine55 synthase